MHRAALAKRVRELETQLAENEQMLEAIRHGNVDAVVVTAPDGRNVVYTLQSSDRPYQVLIEQMQEGAVTLGEEDVILYCNRRFADMLAIQPERLLGQRLDPYISPPERAAFAGFVGIARHGRARGEFTLVTRDNREIPVFISLSVLVQDAGGILLCGMFADLTEQKQHLRILADANARLLDEIAERERVEEALRQAQKMEAVGQLTGGLAHDFNNLLSGISGSLELLERRIAQGRVNDLERYIYMAQSATKRAAAVTHRLLAFSRRQTLDPRPTDVNRLIMDMAELVRRTVGPSIEMELVTSDELWMTLIDASQMENALLNLCINARDAMPHGGRLTIETVNQTLDDYEARAVDVPPGDYIAIKVTDTGCGMTDDVIKRAFDPFFTTKPLGQGTGLGLSMSYGFARQSGGQISIASRTGAGTTMLLHLPRHNGPQDTAQPNLDGPFALPEARHGETVLVVDDEPSVRMLVTEALSDLGYNAIEARDGAEALKLLGSSIQIDLLITDVGLPGGVNGRQVADGGRVHHPNLKVLFITGYAEGAVFDGARLDSGMQILVKPFSIEALGGRIKSLIVS